MSRLNELLEKKRASMWVTIHDGKQVRLLSCEDAHELIQLLCDEREQPKFGPSPLINYERGRADAAERCARLALSAFLDTMSDEPPEGMCAIITRKIIDEFKLKIDFGKLQEPNHASELE